MTLRPPISISSDTLFPYTTLFRSRVPYDQHSHIEGHLAGLAALFNAPLTIGELKIDVAIAFGVNDEFEGSNAQRLAAALVAAEKAIRTRSLWTKYTSRQKEDAGRSEEHTSELQSLMRISYAVFCLKKKMQQAYS